MYPGLFAWIPIRNSTAGKHVYHAKYSVLPGHWIFQANCAAEYRGGRARCHARKARPELFRLFKEEETTSSGFQCTAWDKADSMEACLGIECLCLDALHPRRWSRRSSIRYLAVGIHSQAKQ